MCDAAGDYHQMLRKYFETAQWPLPRTQALGAVEGVKRGVLVAASAVGLLPAHAIAQELSDGTLAEIAADPPLPGLALRIVTPAEGTTSPLVDALVESLRDSPLGAQTSTFPSR
jgi:DNA-binding transcriptional LysR family regulator